MTTVVTEAAIEEAIGSSKCSALILAAVVDHDLVAVHGVTAEASAEALRVVALVVARTTIEVVIGMSVHKAKNNIVTIDAAEKEVNNNRAHLVMRNLGLSQLQPRVL